MTDPLKILQITDLHLLAGNDARLLGVDTADSLRAVLRQATERCRPDVVVATGDITHHGEPAAYARFDAILAEFHNGPSLVLPGNHDLSTPMSGYGPALKVLNLPGWDLIGLDSHEDGRPGAGLTVAQIDELKQCLRATAAAGNHALLAVHHPPLALNCPWLDKDKIQNASELLEWLAVHSTVAAVVFGHAHQIVERNQHQVRLLGTPATCFQFLPESESFAIDMRAESSMPGYRWLSLNGDGGIETRVERVQDYPLNIELPRDH